MANGNVSFEASPQQCTERESRQSAFRKLISDISEYLTPEEVAKCSFIQSIPGRGVSALNALEYLMRKGEFSHDNLEPLAALLRDIKRHDLVTNLVDGYRESYPNEVCQSLPAASVTPKIPVKLRAKSVPSDLVSSPRDPHSNPVEETGNVDAYSPPEGVGHIGQNYTQPVAFVNQVDQASAQQPPAQPGPHTAPIIQPIAVQPSSGMYYGTQQQPQQPQQQPGPVPIPHTSNPPPAMYRTLTPILVPVVSHDAPHSAMTPQSMSASSSVIELQMYTPPSNENLLINDPSSFLSSQTPPMSSQDEAATNWDSGATQLKRPVPKGLPRANSYPRGMVQCIQHGNQSPSHGRNNVTTPPSQLMFVMSAGTRQSPRTQRSRTPPASLGKRVSAPVVTYMAGSGYPASGRHSLPPGLSLRSLSVASECSEVSQPSSATLQQPSELVVLTQPVRGNDNENSANGLLHPHPYTAVESEGCEMEQQSTPSTWSAEQSTVFRRRTGSGKNFLTKLRRLRTRSSSISRISWPVKRDKLNEAIYKHKRDKLLKCPDELELDNGGKHSPKLTLYLHPFGYEEDAGINLTLSVEMTASVKSNLPSSARVQIEVTVIDPATKNKLVGPVAKADSADCRIFRFKQLLTHTALKDLECEHIEIQASARLLQ